METSYLSRTGDRFKAVVERDFDTVFQRVLADGFHSAWKNTLRIPSDGNLNPNYQDVLTYVEAIQARGYDHYNCPVFPLEGGFAEWREGLTNAEQWRTIQVFCEVYDYFLAHKIIKPKQSGLLDKMFNCGYIHKDILPEDYPLLFQIAQTNFDAHVKGNNEQD